jgi:hypothetical protein
MTKSSKEVFIWGFVTTKPWRMYEHACTVFSDEPYYLSFTK